MSAPYETDCAWCGKSFGLFSPPIGKNYCSKKCESENRDSKQTKSSSSSAGCLGPAVFMLIITALLYWI